MVDKGIKADRVRLIQSSNAYVYINMSTHLQNTSSKVAESRRNLRIPFSLLKRTEVQ